MLGYREEVVEMPWQERSIMSERLEFLHLAMQPDAHLTRLCQRFGISRKTGYKWLERYAALGPAGLDDQSRRPYTSPTQTPAEVEELVLALRDRHPAWGGRKLHHRLRALGHHPVPSPSTITAILRRHGRLDPPQARATADQRFEHPVPNDLWQLDYMGHLPLARGRVHPLTLLDDHARFALTVAACANEQQPTVEAHLTRAFQRYGLPLAILTDNGPPWGDSGAGGVTALEAWLIRLGIRVAHGRAYHPQTQGKVERLHRTIQAEVGDTSRFADLGRCQHAFDRFRTTYNLERPHEALGYAVPASRYQPSARPFPDRLPPLAYGPADAVRIVKRHGVISLQNRRYFVGRGLAGEPVAVRPTTQDGVVQVYYCHQLVKTIHLRLDPGVDVG